MAIQNLVGKKRGSSGGNYLKDGRYELMVENFFEKDGHKNVSYICEARVLEAEPTEKNDKGEWIEPNKVGSTVSFVWNTKHDSAEGNTLEAMSMISGEDYDAMSEEDQGTFVDNVLNSNALRGVRVGVESFRYEAKESKRILILPKWRTIEGQTDEMIEAGRKMLSTTVARADRAATVAKAEPAAKPATKAEPAAKPAGGTTSRFLKK